MCHKVNLTQQGSPRFFKSKSNDFFKLICSMSQLYASNPNE